MQEYSRRDIARWTRATESNLTHWSKIGLLRADVRETGGRALALPEVVARPMIARLFRLGLFPFPAGAIDYIKYPCSIAGERFVNETGFKPLFGLRETLRCIRKEP